MKLRALSIRVSTAGGVFGVDVPFAPGLNVLRAENSSGKSTVLQSILFALGMEAMLGPSQAVPLPHAMTDRIRDQATGIDHNVIESSVMLEIENDRGAVATLRRYAAHPSVSTNLISVWESAVLTEGTDAPQGDYFARVTRSVQSESGFYHWLTQFLSLELPLVSRFDEGSVPLYPETFFPLFFVEQKKGWSGVLARVPTQFQIRDVAKRAVEFVLNLEATNRTLRRLELEQLATSLRSRWSAERAEAIASARLVGGTVTGLPEQPPASWPPEPSPQAVVLVDGEWTSLVDSVGRAEARLAELATAPVAQSSDVADGVEAELRVLNASLHDAVRAQAELLSELRVEASELATLRRRAAHLDEEHRRLTDAKRLEQMGSVLGTLVVVGDCPTCHQPLPEALLAPSHQPELISVEDADARTGEQTRLVQALVADAEVAAAAKELQLAAASARASELQRLVRAAKQTLVAPGATPSALQVEERLSVARRVDELRAALEGVVKAMETMAPIVDEWRATLDELIALRKAELSELDESKLSLAETLMVDQLVSYGFRSIDPRELALSREKYTPVHEGFDLGFDISASDMIRLIWSYLLSILEVARAHTTNHIGLLVFDEPRQQDADVVSFAALLRRASTSLEANQQVVFATSSPIEAITAMLTDIPHTIQNYPGLILTRLT